MKNLIAVSALTSALASSAYGAIAFNTVSNASWKTQGSGFYTSPTPTYYVDTLHNIAQSGSNVTGGHGWGAFTASPGNGSTALVADTIAPMMIISTGSGTTNNNVVTFTFSSSAGSAPNTGLFGLFFSFNTSGVSAMTVTAVNGGTNSTSFNPGANPAFIGIWESNFDAIQSVSFDLAPGSTLEITQIEYGLVPTPGALALVGVAGLVGSRRRRA